MTDNIKYPPMHEPDRQAFERRMLDFGWRNFEGSISGSPPCWYYNNAELNSRWIGWREAVRLNAQAVPDGWVLVPVEATIDMLDAFRNHDDSVLGPDFLGAYRAMLSAAPAAPRPAQPLDLGVMELAESVGLIGPASRTDDLHEAIQRFHDLIVVNASIKAARHFADGLAQQPLTDEKDALLRQALDALEGFANIANDSQGVKGYHLNGDIAEWNEFDEVDAASNTIEAIRNHLGAKND